MSRAIEQNPEWDISHARGRDKMDSFSSFLQEINFPWGREQKTAQEGGGHCPASPVNFFESYQITSRTVTYVFHRRGSRSEQ